MQIAAVAGAVATVASAQQQSAAMKQQAANADYEAQVQDMRARQAYAQAGAQEDLQRRRARAAIGTQLASNAQAGGGLNTDLLRQSLYDAENDALAIRYEGQLQGQGMRDDATLQRMQASNLRKQASAKKAGGYLSAATSLVGAGAKYYGGGSGKLNSRIRLLPGEE